MTRRLYLFLLALSLALSLALAQPALAHAQDDDGGQARGEDNLALAINTKDGSSLFRFAFEIRRVAGEVVDNQNVAVSYASCTGCRTLAIAIQIVIVTGSPGTVTPVNAAIALNENCTLCETFASAYQFVIGGSGPLRLTGEGQSRIRHIANEVRELGRSDLPIDEIQARLDELMAELKHVLENELVPGGGDGDDAGEEDDRERAPPTESTPTSTSTESTPTETTVTQTESTETETGETNTDTTETTTTTG